MEQEHTVAWSAQTSSRYRLGRWIVWACFMAGFISLACCIYDLVWPGHFVGDMYGLEVICRLIVLVPAGSVMLLGLAVAERGWSKRSRVARVAGSVLVVLSVIGLGSMAAGVVVSRHQDAVRAGYPSLSTAELLRIAREEKDQFAIDALLVKKDPAAVPGLREILLDESEHGNLRHCAAHALGEIGTDEARVALEQARRDIHDPNLRIAIDDAPQTRMGMDITAVESPSTQPSSEMPATAGFPGR